MCRIRYPNYFAMPLKQLLWVLTFSFCVNANADRFRPVNPVDVGSLVSVRLVSSKGFNSSVYDVDAYITNRSQQFIRKPLRFVIRSTSRPEVRLLNPSGILKGGLPYISFGQEDVHNDDDEGLKPGAMIRVKLKFHNPKKTPFTFTHGVYGVVTSTNHPPSANPGQDRSVPVGAKVNLNAQASSDEDGDSLTYRWRLVSRPSTSYAQLTLSAGLNTQLTIDRSGSYRVELIVNDGKIDSAPAYVTISTENSKPLADAGDDQTVKVQQIAHLDGQRSSDVDGDTLKFSWMLAAKPEGSQAQLQNPATAIPDLTPDLPGQYTAQLIVNDGLLDSLPDFVIISTTNSQPVARAGVDIQGFTGQLLTLDGTRSFDVDNDPLGFSWSILSKPVGSNPNLSAADQVKTQFSADLPGDYIAQLIANDGHVNSEPSTARVTLAIQPPVNHAPKITSTAPVSASIDDLYQYQVTATDTDSDALTYSLSSYPPGMSINAQSGLIQWRPTSGQIGNHTARVMVMDGKNAIDIQAFTITVTAHPQTQIPNVIDTLRTSAEAAILSAKLNIGTLSFEYNAKAAGTVLRQSPAPAIKVDIGTPVNLAISLGTNNRLPPDPKLVAPRLNPINGSSTYSATQFIYTGSNPIQTGVTPGTIQFERAALVSGLVLDKTNQPLSGVTLRIKDHPELGQTLSRADGRFDMVVNGGGVVTLDYQKPGFLPAQRQLTVSWQEYAHSEDTILIPQDSKVNTVNLTDTVRDFQVAQSRVVQDSDGSRQATLLIPKGTHAQIYNPDGTTRSVNTLNLRLTEYTIGANGPQTMPGPLPPSSAYTYAFEIKADEANTKIAGKDVLFDQPVHFYVDNFLGFPAGSVVPVGYYNRDQAAWMPSPDGRVIKILSIAGGSAAIDGNGDGQADNASQLQQLGITPAEQTQLASLYAAGKTLWRVTTQHLSTWDCNWPYKMPDDAVPPKNPSPPQNQPDAADRKNDDPCENDGSIVECENQLLRESIGIAGTPFTLNYASDRVSGRTKARSLHIPLVESLPTLPASLQRIDVEIQVAGRKFNYRLPRDTQSYDFVWDGYDRFGRLLNGTFEAQIKIGYVYRPSYVFSTTSSSTNQQIQASFARFSSASLGLVGSRAAFEAIVYQSYGSQVSYFVVDSYDLDSWSLNAHHRYEPIGKTLNLGNGTRVSTTGKLTNRLLLEPVAGTYAGYSFGGSGSATAFRFSSLSSVVALPDGGFLVADAGINQKIYKVSADGAISVFAGTQSGFSGDGGLALQAKFNSPSALATGVDGSVYFSDRGNQRIRRITPDGKIQTVAGNGSTSVSGDGSFAINAGLNDAHGLAVATDGTLYIADTGHCSIRQVTPDGIISTVFQTAQTCDSIWTQPKDIEIGPDNAVYFSSGNLIYRLDETGKITNFAEFHIPITSMAIDKNGVLYAAVAATGTNSLYTISRSGQISWFAGNGGRRTLGAASTVDDAFGIATGLSVAPNGDIFAAIMSPDHQVLKIRTALPGLALNGYRLPSEDGRLLYTFDSSGQHLTTHDAITGALVYRFEYDNAGRLITLVDGDGLQTRINRDGTGHVRSIEAPFGQMTRTVQSSEGYLTQISNSLGEAYRIGYGTGGLLTQFTHPGGQTSVMTYDSQGLLIKDTNAEGGGLSLTLSQLVDGFKVAVKTGLGKITQHTIRFGGGVREHVYPDGTQSKTQLLNIGGQQTTLPDASKITIHQALDPRPGFHLLAPVSALQTLEVPSASVVNIRQERNILLANAADPLSVVRYEELHAYNSQQYSALFTAIDKTWLNLTPESRQSKAVLDAKGHVVQIQQGSLQAATHRYDSFGRLVASTQGDRSLTYSYGTDGYLSTVIDSLGRQTHYQRDAIGRITNKTLPDGRSIAFAYDANGNLTSLTPPGQPAHVFEYTALDLAQQYQAPLADNSNGQTLYTYNLDQELIRITRADASQLDWQRDSAGRLTQLVHNQNGLDQVLSKLSYDPTTGKAIQNIGPNATQIDTYQGMLRTQTDWSGAFNARIGFGYDSNLRLSSIKLNDINPIDYRYDRDGLLTQAGSLTLTYDNNGQLATTNLRHTAVQTGAALTNNGFIKTITIGPPGPTTKAYDTHETYQYNPYGERIGYLAQYTDVQAQVDSPLLKFDYTRDLLGRITQIQQTLGNGVPQTDAYSYDSAGRLTEVKHNGQAQSQYTYDANGNRLSKTRGTSTETGQYDAQDRLIQYNGSQYSYTPNGERQSKTQGSAVTRYQYDGLSRLTRVTQPDGSVIDYLLDGQGRRVGKKLNGVTQQHWVYQDSFKPLAELNAQGELISRFVYAQHTNVPDYMIKNGATYRLLKDHLGSVRLVLDVSSNTIVQELAYDEFGQVTKDTRPGFQPFGYAGGLYDPDTQLVHFGAREYDAQVGRWLSQDPIGFAGGDSNLYGYVVNDPVNWVDPEGLINLSPGTNPLLGEGLGGLAGGGGLGGGAAALEVEAISLENGLVLRAGSRTPLNLTPRIVDKNGLSASNNLNNALRGKNQIIDTTKLNGLTVRCDNPKTGHVSIVPNDMGLMQDWINSRGSQNIHPLTQELIDSIIGEVKK